MKKMETIKAHYLQLGVKEDNLLYAIDAVKAGSKREHILDNLTADYRGMDPFQATQLLEELFAANGGEFKKENRSGYLYGAFSLLFGLAADFYIFYVLTYGGVLVRPVLIGAVAILGTLGGLFYIYKAISGTFREEEAPFQE